MTLSGLRRGDQCVSDLTIDLRNAGELEAGEGTALERHLAGCAACRARAAEIDASLGANLPGLPVALPRWRRWQGPAIGLCALAAAAALALVVVRRPPVERTRTKGGLSARLYIGSAGAVRLAGPREEVRPGDRLQVLYTSSAPAYLALLSRDGGGRTSVYFPLDPRAAFRAEPGGDVSLPSSTVLDDVLGREALHLVSCPRPFAPAALLGQLERGEPLRAPGCAIESFTLDKRP